MKHLFLFLIFITSCSTNVHPKLTDAQQLIINDINYEYKKNVDVQAWKLDTVKAPDELSYRRYTIRYTTDKDPGKVRTSIYLLSLNEPSIYHKEHITLK